MVIQTDGHRKDVQKNNKKQWTLNEKELYTKLTDSVCKMKFALVLICRFFLFIKLCYIKIVPFWHFHCTIFYDY